MPALDTSAHRRVSSPAAASGAVVPVGATAAAASARHSRRGMAGKGDTDVTARGARRRLAVASAAATSVGDRSGSQQTTAVAV